MRAQANSYLIQKRYQIMKRGDAYELTDLTTGDMQPQLSFTDALAMAWEWHVANSQGDADGKTIDSPAV